MCLNATLNTSAVQKGDRRCLEIISSVSAFWQRLILVIKQANRIVEINIFYLFVYCTVRGFRNQRNKLWGMNVCFLLYKSFFSPSMFVLALMGTGFILFPLFLTPLPRWCCDKWAVQAAARDQKVPGQGLLLRGALPHHLLPLHGQLWQRAAIWRGAPRST